MYIRLFNLLASSVTLSGFILSTIAGPIRFPTSDTSASVAGSAHIITQPSHELYHFEPIPDADIALDEGRTENQSGHDILAATSLHGIALPPDTGFSEGLNPTDTETIQEEPADANSIAVEPEHVETPNPPDARVEHPSPISVEQPSHTVANDHVLDFNVEPFPGFTPHHIQLVDIQTPIATCEPSTQLQDSTATAFHPRIQEKTQNVDISNESSSAAVAACCNMILLRQLVAQISMQSDFDDIALVLLILLDKLRYQLSTIISVRRLTTTLSDFESYFESITVRNMHLCYIIMCAPLPYAWYCLPSGNLEDVSLRSRSALTERYVGTD
ncbi:hypothetical protein EV360DRAFT_74588 [Lentinula raphanica]|nr:hypothetical protein EV360DRAFT_74588 [Lentinula raphanica]